jgi:hypothetical protein
MGDGGTPSERPVEPAADVRSSPVERQLRLDALPEHMASPVFKSFARSAASAASREIAHKLFRKQA